MAGITNIVANLITLISLIMLLGLLYTSYSNTNGSVNPISLFLNSLNTTLNQTLINATAHHSGAESNQSLDAYVLSLINSDRHQFGLSNVTLSNESSGEQHSQSMLAYNYISHWDVYGLKPYMRYTLEGGNESVSENVAYRTMSRCTIFGCSGDINVRSALNASEHDMMYNDQACCNNGHRDNILNPHHNQVSIGIAYNSSSVYLTEDFIDNYITWSRYGFGATNNEMYLSGSMQKGYSLVEVVVTYDAPIMSMSRVQLDNTTSYGYGKQVAGIARNKLFYFTGINTIVADQYETKGNSFSIAFNMQNTMSDIGPGEYTVVTWLNDTNSSFVASSYTIFVGGDGKAYVPSNI
jgi:uncharacterized protein YkwD